MASLPSDDRPVTGETSDAIPTHRTEIRTTVTTVDVTQLCVALVILVVYGAILVSRGSAPEELKAAVYVIVGAIIAKKVPQ